MSLPFKNLKFCSTSVPSDIRLDMVSKIKAMGGEHFSHLMSDVDVLIIGDRDTDKFRYSVKHRLDITFVRPKALYTLYDQWMNGETKDLSVNSCLMPVFDGLNICISRITDPKEKKDVIQLIRDYNGSLTDSLTVNNTCVIASERSGKRYEKALEWGIPVVHPQWITDSVKRGAALEYSYYEISKVSTDDIGKDSCNCWEALSKAKISFKRPLEDTEKTVKTAKRENNIWNNIMGNVKPPSMKAMKDTAWDDNQTLEGISDEEVGNYHHSKRRKDDESTTSQIFSNFHFGIHGFKDPLQLTKLKKVIHSHQGIVSDNVEKDFSRITHLLIPSNKTLGELDLNIELLKDRYDYKVVTEWFIERCLHYNQIRYDKWGMPFNHGNFNFNLKIAISGFTGIELLHTIKLIKFLGCEYCETLTANRDLLVINLAIIGLNKDNSSKLFSYKYPEIISCSDSNKAGLLSTKNKINACKKWNIPIVSMAYLMESIDIGYLPELLDYKWCIFAPKNLAKPKNLMEYLKTVSNDMFITPTDTIGKNDALAKDGKTESLTLPKLPSPLKKKKKNWGRLIGRAQESQLSRNFLEDETQSGVKFADEPSTQISYNDSGADTDSIPRRDTRNHLKELEHEL